MNNPNYTPWGNPDTTTELAPGIVSYTTPSHGGIWVDKAQRQTWPLPLWEYKPFAGEGWYEEDQDWVIVALARPGLFSPKDVRAAVRTTEAMMAYKGYKGRMGDWGVVNAWLNESPAGHLVVAIADAWAIENAGKWVRNGLGTAGKGWAVRFKRIGDDQDRTVVMAEYPTQEIYTTEELDALEAANEKTLTAPTGKEI